MAMYIDGNQVPAALEQRGDYRFPAASIVRRNGQGLGIVAPTRSIEWTFRYLRASELAFFNTTVLAGADSKLCTGTNTFYDPTTGGTEVTFSSCVLDRPDLQTSPRGGLYRNVTINIRAIRA